MAATHEVAPDALPYFDQGYDDPGVREMVGLLSKPMLECNFFRFMLLDDKLRGKIGATCVTIRLF